MDWYLYTRAFHMMAVIAWMAGLFYLPRLFAYHTRATPGSELSETFKVMERRLLNIIMTPAMVISWTLGLILIFVFRDYFVMTGWLHVKLTLVVLLTAYHGVLEKWRRDFAADRNTRNYRFYAMMNEIPTLLMIGIVIMVIVKPF